MDQQDHGTIVALFYQDRHHDTAYAGWRWQHGFDGPLGQVLAGTQHKMVLTKAAAGGALAQQAPAVP